MNRSICLPLTRAWKSTGILEVHEHQSASLPGGENSNTFTLGLLQTLRGLKRIDRVLGLPLICLPALVAPSLR